MYNVGEYGQSIYFNVGEDVSLNTNELILCKPDGTELTKTALVGTTDFTTTTKGLFSANQYVFYQVVEGDLDVAGQWKFRVISTTSTNVKKKTDWQKAIVKD